jgi:hypothetical protein
MPEGTVAVRVVVETNVTLSASVVPNLSEDDGSRFVPVSVMGVGWADDTEDGAMEASDGGLIAVYSTPLKSPPNPPRAYR